MYLPFWMLGLTPEMKKRAEVKLGETPRVKKQAVEEFRKLIDEQAEANFRPCVEEEFLVRFLRAKKYNVGKAHKNLRNFYIFKARNSGVLTDLKPSDVKDVLECNNIAILPKRLPSGTAVGILRLGSFDTDKVTAERMAAASSVFFEAAIEPEATQVCGYAMVIDLTDLSLSRTMHYATRPTLIQNWIHMMQDCIPYRIKAVHVVNNPFHFNILFNVMNRFLNPKVAKRFHFHGYQLESLHRCIPPAILPTELGGESGSTASLAEECNAHILRKEKYFEKFNKYGFQGTKFTSSDSHF